MTRDWRDFADDILQAARDINSFVAGRSFEDFASDKKTVYAVFRCLEIIGEASKNIPQDVRAAVPDVPWKKMAGMRDRIIHGYFDTELEVV